MMVRLIFVSILFLHSALGYFVILNGDTQSVLGGTVNIQADIYADGGYHASGSFQYVWADNAIPQHTYVETTTSSTSRWNITYEKGTYAPGPYNIQVEVKKKDWFGFWEEITSRRMAINVTSLLEGDLQIVQGGTIRKQYVATNATAWHNITLFKTDEDFLKHHKPNIMTYWFIDCEYKGSKHDLSLPFNYTTADATRYIEVLVVGKDFPPTPAPTTTTPSPNATTTTTAASPNTTTTTAKPTTTSTTASSTSKSPPITSSTVPAATTTAWSEWLKGFPARNNSLPAQGFCVNITTMPTSPDATYGYFQKKLIAKAPVQIVNMNGSNWLQDGDILNVGLACNGSGPFNYCVQLANGQYNVTGNETCDKGKAKPLIDCGLSFSHLFTSPQEYTLVFIISNSVSKLVTPFGINVYKVTKQPQLSVIVVPVVFSILAVISIIFGVAFYFHSRRTFTVEVADFDFGQQTSELEHKTFLERLRESVMHSFFRANDPADADSSWSPSRKYGSMQ